jgi:hypothetical protein
VTVETFSNELENFNSPTMAQQFQFDPNTKIGPFVATTICSDNSNGQCIVDPNELGCRFYMTRVTAMDEAGLTSTADCYQPSMGTK